MNLFLSKQGYLVQCFWVIGINFDQIQIQQNSFNFRQLIVYNKQRFNGDQYLLLVKPEGMIKISQIICQQQVGMDQKLAYRLKEYYSIWEIRTLVNVIYVINQILLIVYLLFIPIQVAYYWLLRDADNGYVQTWIDVAVLVFFTMHILLFLDDKLYEWLKNPYSEWYHKIITIQLGYDIACMILAIYATTVVDKSIVQRGIELLFFFKIYKLVKFDIKCMYIVVGTWFYSLYKILRTLLVVFMAIAYIGSLFYGVAYYLYLQNISDEQYLELIWIYSTGAIDDLVSYPFIIQVQYAMYWALGTASTAAYGDISAAQPTLVLVNIFALAFEGFLFGFYLNTMHSIPLENKQKEADLLQKFDAFQQHCSNRKISKKLYLQILCSLEYTQSQKRRLDQIQKLMPRKYLQQIKANIYYDFLSDSTFFGNSEFQLQISQKVSETVCQMGEDVYNYRSVNEDDLLYVKQGKINYYLQGEIKQISLTVLEQGCYFGLYQFLTGLLVPQHAICLNYCSIYKITRVDYKSLMPQGLKLRFSMLQSKGFRFQGEYLKMEPVVRFVNYIQQSSDYPFFNQAKKQELSLAKYSQAQRQRKFYRRQSIKSKLARPKYKKYKNVETQTQNGHSIDVDEVYIWNKNNQNIQTSIYQDLT